MNRKQYITNIIGQKKIDEIARLEKKYEETQSPQDLEAYEKLATWAYEMVTAEDYARCQ